MRKLEIGPAFKLQFFIITLIAFALFSARTASAAVLDTLHYNGHTYYLISENNWSGAAGEAVLLGGYLATVKDQGGPDFLGDPGEESPGPAEGRRRGPQRHGHQSP